MIIERTYRATFMRAARMKTPAAWDAVLRHKLMLACGCREGMRDSPCGGKMFWANLIFQHRMHLILFLEDPATPHPAHDVHLLCDLAEENRQEFADELDLYRMNGWWSRKAYGGEHGRRSRIAQLVDEGGGWIPNDSGVSHIKPRPFRSERRRFSLMKAAESNLPLYNARDFLE